MPYLTASRYYCAVLYSITKVTTEHFLLQPLVCGTVFPSHVTAAPSLSPSSAVVLNHISSHFLIPLSDSSLICTVPAQWLIILDTIIAFTFNILISTLLLDELLSNKQHYCIACSRLFSSAVSLYRPLLLLLLLLLLLPTGKCMQLVMWTSWHWLLPIMMHVYNLHDTKKTNNDKLTAHCRRLMKLDHCWL